MANAVEHFETAHVRQPQIEHDAVARVFAQGGKRAGAGARCDDLDVVMIEQLPDAHLFRRIVLDDEQAFAAWLGILHDLGQRRADPFGRGWLADIRKCAAGQGMLTVFVQCDDLNRNVPCQRVMFQLTEHGPAEHVGQEDIERYRGGLELLGEIQGFGAAGRAQDLKALIARQIDQDARIMRIILNDQKNRIPRFEIEAVIRDLFDDALLRRDLQRRRRASPPEP